MGTTPPENIQRQFYRPVCNESEIDRIFNISTADDYLLKIRADTIVDHMRLYRVYRNKALINERQWSLEKSFRRDHFDKFLNFADGDVRAICSDACAGNMFSTDPTAKISTTEFGPIVTVCESLQFFIKDLSINNFCSNFSQSNNGRSQMCKG